MLAESVKTLLQERGYNLTLKREGNGGSYDPATGSITGGSTSTETIRGVFIDYMNDEIDGTRIKESDRKLLVQASGMSLTPQTSDLIDDELRVVSVRTLKDDDGIMAYTLQVRS